MNTSGHSNIVMTQLQCVQLEITEADLCCSLKMYIIFKSEIINSINYNYELFVILNIKTESSLFIKFSNFSHFNLISQSLTNFGNKQTNVVDCRRLFESKRFIKTCSLNEMSSTLQLPRQLKLL